MSEIPLVRPGTEFDLPAINEIYNHYVVHTPVTFDLEPMPMDERLRWFSGFAEAGPHRLLVSVDHDRLVAYAASKAFRSRPAYRTSVETSVYCHPDATGRGIGSALYGALFEALREEPVHRAFAGVTMPNDASVALHRRLGFTDVGTFREAGFKFGRYWDVRWFEKPL